MTLCHVLKIPSRENVTQQVLVRVCRERRRPEQIAQRLLATVSAFDRVLCYSATEGVVVDGDCLAGKRSDVKAQVFRCSGEAGC